MNILINMIIRIIRFVASVTAFVSLLFGLICCALMVLVIAYYIKWRRHGIIVSGKVLSTETDTIMNKEILCHTLSINYQEQEHRFKIFEDVKKGKDSFSVDESVDLYYRPDNNDVESYKNIIGDLHLFPKIIAACIAVTAICGLLYLCLPI